MSALLSGWPGVNLGSAKRMDLTECRIAENMSSMAMVNNVP